MYSPGHLGLTGFTKEERHHWQSHGPVMWDNRQTMNHVRRFDETKDSRDIRRTTISSDGRATPQVIQT